MGMARPMMFNPMLTSQMVNPLLASQMLRNGSTMYMMPSGGYGGNMMSYGGSGMYSMSTGGYGSSQMSYGGNNSASPAYDAPAGTSPLPKVPTADDVLVSGPLNIPPPHCAVIRLRLPRTWTDVSFDGLKIDSMGQARNYVTPELPAARTFEVTATWTNNGRTTRLQEQVTVKAGQIRTLDFRSGK
jgi:uncharacterized protein (TIGR03000 family)